MKYLPILYSFLLLVLIQLIQGRPNPVPDEDVDILEKYERDHAKIRDYHRVKRHRRYMSEDPDDQEVIDELPDFFHKIRRRNLDQYPTRRNVFQEIIEKQKFEHHGHDDSYSA